MFYCCCPLGLWNVDWSTGTPFCMFSMFRYICLRYWFVLIFPSVCFLQGARALSAFGGRFTDPELSRLTSSLPLRCLGAN